MSKQVALIKTRSGGDESYRPSFRHPRQQKFRLYCLYYCYVRELQEPSTLKPSILAKRFGVSDKTIWGLPFSFSAIAPICQIILLKSP
ncbi:MAG: hypothetical protein IGR93_07825 [Hydrococcus sp. C42_A2020_068]|uniref:hypothetical protein n=1 Tax=Pleurocapsa sp. PCC 7327 TaxID=118163 RepID=UPI00059C1445|nr:hypothetical protein [Pleurocapsa sp. PCC 7327]MBF2019999.1 hypothetical protein [Hydrococcus sp. C42_A2020_068]